MYLSPRSRFSLIELLFVIVIFLLLAAIVLPMLAKARERARRVNCAKQLQQIGLAMVTYTRENNGYLPISDPPPTNSWGALATSTELASEPRLWNCPSRSDVRLSGTNSAYIYIGSGLRDNLADPGSVSAAHDEYDNHPRNSWNNVLFVDGHVEGKNPETNDDFSNEY